MQPTTPVLEEFADKEVVWAEDQPQYTPLPSLVRFDGVVLTRWKLTEEERAAIAAGSDLFLFLLTFGHPLQPVLLEVGEESARSALLTLKV